MKNFYFVLAALFWFTSCNDDGFNDKGLILMEPSIEQLLKIDMAVGDTFEIK